jgi:hypothetical protein
MGASTSGRKVARMDISVIPQSVSYPVAASARLYKGCAVTKASGSGYATTRTGDTGYSGYTTDVVLGIADEDQPGIPGNSIDNSSGSNGDKNVKVIKGCFKLANSGSNAITAAMVGSVGYLENNQTVGTDSANYPPAGTIVKVVDGTEASERGDPVAGVYIQVGVYNTTTAVLVDATSVDGAMAHADKRVLDLLHAAATTVTFSVGAGAIAFGASSSGQYTCAALTAGGVNTLTVTSTTGAVSGQLLRIQRTDTAAPGLDIVDGNNSAARLAYLAGLGTVILRYNGTTFDVVEVVDRFRYPVPGSALYSAISGATSVYLGAGTIRDVGTPSEAMTITLKSTVASAGASCPTGAYLRITNAAGTAGTATIKNNAATTLCVLASAKAGYAEFMFTTDWSLIGIGQLA